MFRASKKAFGRRAICAILLAAAAFAVNRSATLGWGGAWASEDTRYKVSPVGILHVLQPRQPVSPHVWSRWIPEIGDPSLRAVALGGEGAFARLKLTYPALQLAFWLSLVGAVVVLLPLQKLQNPVLIVTLAAFSAFTVLAAVTLFITSASRALAVLASLDFGYGGTFGCMLVSAAPLLSVGAMGLFLQRLKWLPFLGLLAFNLVVWHQSLLFLVPIAALMLFVASCFNSRDIDDGPQSSLHD